jgi:hypothetical protein
VKIKNTGPIITITLIIALTIIFPITARGKAKTRTGFFLSLGHLNYSYKTFADDESEAFVGEPSDLFFGVSLYWKNQFEINLVYNRSTDDFGSAPQVIAYDKDGFGLEVGKIIPIHLFKKGSFDVSLEFVGGGYGILYPFKKKNSGSNLYFDAREPGEDSLFYQAGFYWAFRLKYQFAQKASFDIGFKSMIPVRSNEFIETRGKEILLLKSFFTIGVSF